MLNRLCIMGRLAKDPELRQTQSGKSVASFRIACDRGRKDQSGQSLVDWFDVVAWAQTAEFVVKYFQRGSMIALDGRLQSRQYQDKNGNNRTAIEIVADSVNFCGAKQQNGGGAPQGGYQQNGGYQQQPGGYSAPAQTAGQQAAYPQSNYGDDFQEIDDNEDLPF